MRRILKPLLIFRAGRAGNPNGDCEALDLSRRRAAHLLFDSYRRTCEVEIKCSGDDAHGGQHARTE